MSGTALEHLLSRVTKPGRYSGGEWNSVRKEWGAARVHFALAYPDTYEVGMSNLGVGILYELLNNEPDILAERVYAPWGDMERALAAGNVELYTLESRRPLRQFDLLGFSLQYELNYSNVLSMLHLAGIPLLASERDESWPIVLAGGSCNYNPEPMADFIDLFVLGDGEEVLLELVRLYAALRAAPGYSKADFLRRAALLHGVYVPSLYRVTYHADGCIASIEPTDKHAPAVVEKRIVKVLPPPPARPVVPYLEVIHDRVAVEIMRGCSRGCRFCQAGMVYRPVRERPVVEVLEAVERQLAATGHEEVSLVSLSSTDYSGIRPLLEKLQEKYARQRISISLPSLRTDAFSVELAHQLQRTRKSGLTFAPEAGSERLRAVINKGVTAADLLATAEAAFRSGWQRIKLYFMIGLPTETDEDVLAIATLVKDVLAVGRRHAAGRARLSVSVSTFIPKAHTPFQWAAMCPAEVVARRQAILQRELRLRSVELSWSDEATSRLEGVLSRGDRRLGRVIQRAWELGARFDAWAECFRPDLWAAALNEAGLDPAFYTERERARDEVLPWSRLSSGVSDSFLWDENERSIQGQSSENCREACLGCGIRESFDLSRCPVTLDGVGQ
ncbi:MAG TPA: TIGR03960 family B12-binding radical SAM protein [Anaerolineae bacterium]|nr:TIGR03960 family B12-binding radical SAM protein [Anaerolineae bacterium]